ncbi:MAG: CARDB domain-containing protein, partial [Candidatus Odinarchaeota archaeon]
NATEFAFVLDQHDLYVSLEAPEYIRKGETALINTTVFNNGTYDESNVELRILIDDAVKASQTYTSLLIGSSEILSYSWIPAAGGTFNITAYAVPVTGETLLLNNNATEFAFVLDQHDLYVSLEAPEYIRNGKTGYINATVFNNGTYDENSVELRLLLDDVVVASQTYPTLLIDGSATITYTWSPAPNDIYNFTTYVVPVTGEIILLNNNATQFVPTVDPSKCIGFVYTHGESLISSSLKAYYEGLGYIVDEIVEPITDSLLQDYGYIFVGESGLTWSSSEITAVQDFITDGGVFVAVGDSSPSSGAIQIASDYGITFMGTNPGTSGATTVIDSSHLLMRDLTTIYLPGIYNALSVSAPAVPIIWDSTGTGIYGAAADIGDGHLLILADDFDDYYTYNDNEILFSNILRWYPYDHELRVILEAPTSFKLGETVLISATVYNEGANDETSVELQVLIDDVVVTSQTYPSLLSGTRETLSYSWTPSAGGTYNITTYAVPITGETDVSNNLATNFVYIIDQHDLEVYLAIPPSLQLGDTALISATIYNNGTYDENSVELQLFLNDAIVASQTYPTFLIGETASITYSWSVSNYDIYNFTAYAAPVTGETDAMNNVVTEIINIGTVAILNSNQLPSYFTGGWTNDYQLLHDGLTAAGIPAVIITNEDILNGALANFNVLILIDNAPNETASAVVRDWWLAGGDIISFDSSICFLNWAGILPPEAAGTSGSGVYWNYDSPSTGVVVDDTHPVMNGYSNDTIVSGAGGDSQYFDSMIQGTSAAPYYIPLVKTAIGSDYDLVVAYVPGIGGQVVHIWDYNHWATVSNQQMIMNAITWANGTLRVDYPPTVTVTYPNKTTTLYGTVTVSWTASDPNGDSLTYDLYYWDSSSWVPLVAGLTTTSFSWNTATVPDGSGYRIRVVASDGIFTVEDESDDWFSIDQNTPQPPIVTIISPNGGETFIGGSTVTISWTASDPNGDSLTYDVYYKDASFWNLIAPGVTGTSYAWDTTGLPGGTTYKVRVVASDGSLTGEDQSDGYFTIHVNHPPSVTVISPNGGESLHGTVAVSWTASDPDDDSLTYNVYYWDNSSWVELATGVTGTDFSWDTTGLSNGDYYRIRVVASDGAETAEDESDSAFTVENPSTKPASGFEMLTLAVTLLGIATTRSLKRHFKSKRIK